MSDGAVTVDLRLGDCLDVLPTLGHFDVVVTDPPYPNFLAGRYQYNRGLLNFLDNLSCPQFVFWTVTEPFPLTYSTRHTWHKQTGTYATVEYIYERNGQHEAETFSYQKIKNSIDAQMNRDILTGHPSQKPIRLMKAIIRRFDLHGVVLDPFMGSGSTLAACIAMGLDSIGIERDPGYFAIAQRRIEQAQAQLALPLFSSGE